MKKHFQLSICHISCSFGTYNNTRPLSNLEYYWWSVHLSKKYGRLVSVCYLRFIFNLNYPLSEHYLAMHDSKEKSGCVKFNKKYLHSWPSRISPICRVVIRETLEQNIDSSMFNENEFYPSSIFLYFQDSW